MQKKDLCLDIWEAKMKLTNFMKPNMIEWEEKLITIEDYY